MRDLVKPEERTRHGDPIVEDWILIIVTILCVGIVVGSVVLNLP